MAGAAQSGPSVPPGQLMVTVTVAPDDRDPAIEELSGVVEGCEGVMGGCETVDRSRVEFPGKVEAGFDGLGDDGAGEEMAAVDESPPRC